MDGDHMIPQRNEDGTREGKQAFVAPEPVVNGAADPEKWPHCCFPFCLGKTRHKAQKINKINWTAGFTF